MAKFNDTVEATLKAYFEAGDMPTAAQFAEWITAIQAGIDEHTHVGISAGDGLQALGSVAGPLTLVIANTGLRILDTGGDHYLRIVPGSDLSGNRTLTITTGDAHRTLILGGNPTLDNWFDQNVKQAATPEFAGVTIGAKPVSMVRIAETILGAPAASITFAAIPGTYRSLYLLAQLRTDRAAEYDYPELQFNADAGNNYDQLILAVDGTPNVVAGPNRAGSFTAGICEAANSRANNFSPLHVKIDGYALADREKWILSHSAAFGDVSADADMFGYAPTWGRWRSVAAITQIVIVPSTGPNWVAGSRATLYGVL